MTATSKPDQAPARSRGSSRARRRGTRNRDGNPPQNPQNENDLFDVDNGGEEVSSAPRDPDVPALHLSELKALHVSELLQMATEAGVEGANRLRKQELVFALLRNRAM